MTRRSGRSAHHRLHTKWDHYFISRSTPAKFFCAVFYVAVCSILFMIYIWHYPGQHLIALSDTKGDAVVRGLKTVEKFQDTQKMYEAFENISKLITVKKSQESNATEAPLTSPALQPIEPKNWAGGGYESIPGNKQLIKHCSTCAVVTSSGHLKGSKEGANIDNADCVIRMNSAPTLKYEDDVGSRTTFRVIGHRNFPAMFKKEDGQKYYITNTTTKSDYVVVTWLYGVNLKRNTPYKMCQVLAKKYKGFKCYLGTEDTMNRHLDLFYNELGIARNKIKLWLSTGWTALLFALEVCDKVDAYGMVYDGYCDEYPKDKTLYHYYDRVRSECSYYSKSERRATGGHKFLTEKAIFGKWASLYNITFHRPSWEGHLQQRNLSSSIDSPYKRIYHYLQWKEEHESENNATKNLTSELQGNIAMEAANITIRNKPPSKADGIEQADTAAEAEDDSNANGPGNDTMRSDNIVAFRVDGTGLVVVDRETGKSVKVFSEKRTNSTFLIKQKYRKGGAIKKSPSRGENKAKSIRNIQSNLQDKTNR